jgi:hypothetical protein
MSHKAFRIVVGKRASGCRNCGRTIERGEKKLIYQMDYPTYSSSCCRDCAVMVLEEFHLIERH